MSPSEIKEILHEIDIRPGEVDNRKLTEVLPILFQLIERLSQENMKRGHIFNVCEGVKCEGVKSPFDSFDFLAGLQMCF